MTKEPFVAYVTTPEPVEEGLFYLVWANTPGDARRLLEADLDPNCKWHQISPVAKTLGAPGDD